MQLMSNLVKVSIPNYLTNLPVPNSIGGWFKLSFRDWLSLIPPAAIVGGLGYTFYLAYCPKARQKPSCRFNTMIRPTERKVMDVVDIEDIVEEKTYYCRCWKSETWPFCDGVHGKYNRATGDNLGPLLIQRKVESK